VASHQGNQIYKVGEKAHTKLISPSIFPRIKGKREGASARFLESISKKKRKASLTVSKRKNGYPKKRKEKKVRNYGDQA